MAVVVGRLRKCNVFDNPFTFSADELAREILGRPIVNTALLGAFAAMTGELTLDAVLKAVQSKFPGSLGEKNARIVERSYQMLREA
jgi:pyruvate ferredoxin oxidoreductase gamma subunit